MNVSQEDFMNLKNLSIEERKEVFRKLIHAKEEDTHIAGVLLNAESGEQISIAELAEKIGEEELIDMLCHIVDTDSCYTETLSMKEMRELLNDYCHGNCSEEKAVLAKSIISKICETDCIQFQHGLTDVLLDFVNMAQKDIGYNPFLVDVISIIKIVSLISMIHMPNGNLNYLKDMNPVQVTEIATQIGDDIYDTWKKTCTTPVKDELVIAGLLHAATKLASKIDLRVADAKIIADHLGIELVELPSENELENGSNDSDDSDDQKMRDLLKNN